MSDKINLNCKLPYDSLHIVFVFQCAFWSVMIGANGGGNQGGGNYEIFALSLVGLGISFLTWNYTTYFIENLKRPER